MAGVDCINKPLAAAFTLPKKLTFFLFILSLVFMLISRLLIIYMQPSDHPNPPMSFHLTLLSLHPLFQTVSIPMCKGHPGNTEAAVDREINKQKKRERSDGGQSLVIHGVNYRPTSHKHTPKAGGSWGRLSLSMLSLYVCLYYQFLCCYCSFSLSLILLVLSFPCGVYSSVGFLRLPPSPSGDLCTQAVRVIETFLDRDVTLYSPLSVCFYLERTWEVITAE